MSVLAAAADVRREELKDLQGRIQALQRDIARTEESRADAAEELRETEKAISEAGRKLRQLAAARAEARSSLDQLETQSRQLSARIAGQQRQLARLFMRQYHAGERDTLRHLLAGQDPYQIARDLHYLSLLSRAKAGLVRELGAILEEKKRLAGQARARAEELSEIELRWQREHDALLQQRKKRQALLARLSERLQAQRREIDRLRRDERRLARLIAGLGRIVTGARQAKRPQALRRNERSADLAADRFARLKGKLSWPTRGELGNRFGAPRQGGGTTWKGLFIRAPHGAEVKAVASGRIVFADWLRGFGNLAIVDHGEGYLTVYGNNEALFKSVGQPVQSGEVIAAVGDSGGNAETGLYFELRHLGQPLDPLQWVSPK